MSRPEIAMAETILQALGIPYRDQLITSVNVFLDSRETPLVTITRYVDKNSLAEISQRFKLVALDDNAQPARQVCDDFGHLVEVAL